MTLYEKGERLKQFAVEDISVFNSKADHWLHNQKIQHTTFRDMLLNVDNDSSYDGFHK